MQLLLNGEISPNNDKTKLKQAERYNELMLEK